MSQDGENRDYKSRLQKLKDQEPPPLPSGDISDFGLQHRIDTLRGVPEEYRGKPTVPPSVYLGVNTQAPSDEFDVTMQTLAEGGHVPHSNASNHSGMNMNGYIDTGSSFDDPLLAATSSASTFIRQNAHISRSEAARSKHNTSSHGKPLNTSNTAHNHAAVDEDQAYLDQILYGAAVPHAKPPSPISGAGKHSRKNELSRASSISSQNRRQQIHGSRGQYAHNVSRLVQEAEACQNDIVNIYKNVHAIRAKEEQKLRQLYGNEAYERMMHDIALKKQQENLQAQQQQQQQQQQQLQPQQPSVHTALSQPPAPSQAAYIRNNAPTVHPAVTSPLQHTDDSDSDVSVSDEEGNVRKYDSKGRLKAQTPQPPMAGNLPISSPVAPFPKANVAGPTGYAQGAPTGIRSEKQNHTFSETGNQHISEEQRKRNEMEECLAGIDDLIYEGNDITELMNIARDAARLDEINERSQAEQAQIASKEEEARILRDLERLQKEEALEKKRYEEYMRNKEQKEAEERARKAREAEASRKSDESYALAQRLVQSTHNGNGDVKEQLTREIDAETNNPDIIGTLFQIPKHLQPDQDNAVLDDKTPHEPDDEELAALESLLSDDRGFGWGHGKTESEETQGGDNIEKNDGEIKESEGVTQKPSRESTQAPKTVSAPAEDTAQDIDASLAYLSTRVSTAPAPVTSSTIYPTIQAKAPVPVHSASTTVKPVDAKIPARPWEHDGKDLSEDEILSFFDDLE